MDIQNPFVTQSILDALKNMSTITFHVFSVPHNPTHIDFSCCAFAQKARKLCLMLKMLGHKVIHYGNELSDVVCDLHITVTSEQDLMEAYPNCKEELGHVDYENPENPHAISYMNEKYTLTAAYEARKHHKEGDYFCYVVPTIQRELFAKVADLPVHHIETGVGYMGSYMPYRIFESPGIQAWHYGYFASNFDRYSKLSDEEKKVYPFDRNTHRATYEVPGFDAVVPNSFDIDLFDFKTKKGKDLLFLGRVIEQKGVMKAVKIAERLGKKLIIAGPGDFEKEFGMKVPKHVEIVGPVNPEQRRVLLSEAFALLCISDYWEPFGGIHIEAMLSGTVPVASNNGGFTHTIRSGWNGYRLSMNKVEQGIWACQNLDRIDPYVLRDFGLRFSNEQIALRYGEYFESLTRVIRHNGDFLDIENPYRDNLDWLDYDRKIDWPDGWMIPVDVNQEEKEC